MTKYTNLRCLVRIFGTFHPRDGPKSIFVVSKDWLVSIFIPMNSKKFEFRDFDSFIGFAIKNESEIEKLKSRDRRIFLKIRFYEIETLTHNFVKSNFQENPAVM